MNSTPQTNDAAATLWLDRIVRVLQRNNFFNLISALLMLIGCYIVCLPYLFEFKTLRGLIVLLTVINIYEAMVIGACAFMIRKRLDGNESALLLLVELLFLMDATYTVNGCLVVEFERGRFILAGSLAAAMVKIAALEIGAGLKVFHRLKAVLFAAIVFVLSFQPALNLSVGWSPVLRQAVSYTLWLIYGALPMLILLTRPDLGGLSGWRSAAFRKLILGIAIGLAGYQLAGQTWVYGAPFSPIYLAPFALSLLTVLPIAAPNMKADTLLFIRVSVAAVLLAASLLPTGTAWPATLAGGTIYFSPLRWNMAFAALACFIVWRREKKRGMLNLACVFATLALMGHDPHAIAEFAWNPDWLALLLSAPVAWLWLHRHRGYWRMLAVASLYLFCISHKPADAPNAAFEMACYWPVVAFILSLLAGFHARIFQFALLAAIACAGMARYPTDEWASLLYFVAAFATLCTATMIFKRSVFAVLPGYLAGASYLRFGNLLPRAHINWGWVVIAAAFVVFGAAFLVTRSRVTKTIPAIHTTEIKP